MKKIYIFLTLFILFLILTSNSHAAYDPFLKKNNIFGIHILFTSELSEAASLVNSSGGDWGYVTIPIQALDRDLDKWQKFMDECKRHHVIPIIRIATSGDYFIKVSWSKPTEYDVLDFANFLNSLDWPTKNRYVVIFNEQNRGDEWGGSPSASEYAKILDYSVDIFKQKNSDFFIISGGLDNASVNIQGQSVNQFTYIQQMEDAIPGIFSKIDGISAHAYPNPAFSSPPSSLRTGINSFLYQKQLVGKLSGKKLPIFITETGWSSNTVSQDIQSTYYTEAFENYWNGEDIVAVTPFIFNSSQGSFEQFSFLRNNEKTKIYNTYFNFPKIKGEPKLTGLLIIKNEQDFPTPIKTFSLNKAIDSVFEKINDSSLNFFKWLINN